MGPRQGLPQYITGQGQQQYGHGQGQHQYGLGQGQHQYGLGQGQHQYGLGQGQPQYGLGQGQHQYGLGQGQHQYGLGHGLQQHVPVQQFQHTPPGVLQNNTAVLHSQNIPVPKTSSGILDKFIKPCVPPNQIPVSPILLKKITPLPPNQSLPE